MNHLINEKSPYLLQHTGNPVNWFPWSDTAFKKAKTEDKPIFLSIGYSTCHWCHVMAHESFEDPEVAAVLNRDYISIKVDREERPDIDSVYMSVCQAMTGSGGWPLTILMTPDKKPFFAGTYLPKQTAYGRTGLLELLSRANDLWNTQRGKLYKTGDEITAYLQPVSRAAAATPEKLLIHRALLALFKSFDYTWGGFGNAPKFPMAHNLSFLLKIYALEGNEKALNVVSRTLSHMMRGGIFDHIGGGFSRYSTDNMWLAPHFEKMLYDNALLISAYGDAYKYTGEKMYLDTVKKTVSYILNELTGEEGGFFCSQDADSEGVEGKYYTFTPLEIIDVLEKKEGKYFCRYFGITDEGNFEGKSIPNLIYNDKWNKKDIKTDSLCEKLYMYRVKRTHLHTDDKILTSWNSMMIASLAKASFICGELSWLEAAQKSCTFLENHLTDNEGCLFIRYRDGETAYKGQLDDYAFYALALIELYKVTWDTRYLSRAIEISKRMLNDFLDRENGGFYMYSNASEQLLSRPKETYDGAMPSGNSAAAHVLSDLAALTGEEYWRLKRDRQLEFMAAAAEEIPSAFCYALSAMCKTLYPSQELICVSAEIEMPEDTVTFLRHVPYPNLTVLFKSPQNSQELAELVPFTKNYPLPDEGVHYYLCREQACSPAFTDISHLKKILS